MCMLQSFSMLHITALSHLHEGIVHHNDAPWDNQVAVHQLLVVSKVASLVSIQERDVKSDTLCSKFEMPSFAGPTYSRSSLSA